MDAPVAPGTLLLSVPQMLDPNFMHSVVLMIEHNQHGALGLVINQPVDASLGELVGEHPLLAGLEFPMHCGGPVGRDSMQFLHRLPEVIPGGLDLGDGLFLGGELEDLAEALRAGAVSPGSLRMFVGYSGWGGGQLEQEFGTGSWVPAPPNPDLCFGPETGEHLWRAALRGLGDAGQGLSQLPPDVTWN